MSIDVTTEVAIRPGERRDLETLTGIYNYYISETAITFDTEPFTVETRTPWFERYATSGRHRLFVAERDGEVVGYTTSSPYSPRKAYDRTVETTILCAPHAVGHGIGKLLYARLFEALAAEDVHRVLAGVTLPNRGSVDIHHYFGFEDVGVLTESGFKFGKYWDVAWFWKRMR